MFTLEEITIAVCRHWRDELPEPVATAFPGVSLATDQISAWLELGWDEWASVLRREGDPEQIRFQLRLRCFARPDLETGRVLQLADYGRGAFSDRDVPIVDHEVSEAAVVGWIRFDAGVMWDFSVHDRDQRKPPLRHVEWTWRASVRG